MSEELACLFCGEVETVELLEVWGHEFMLKTCSESLHEQIATEMNDNPAWAASFMRSIGTEVLCGRRLRRVTDDEGVALGTLRLERSAARRSSASSRAITHIAVCRSPGGSIRASTPGRR